MPLDAADEADLALLRRKPLHVVAQDLSAKSPSVIFGTVCLHLVATFVSFASCETRLTEKTKSVSGVSIGKVMIRGASLAQRGIAAKVWDALEIISLRKGTVGWAAAI